MNHFFFGQRNDLLNSLLPIVLQVHVLTREVFGMSTFSVAMRLLKTLPVWLVDYILVSYSRLALGDTAALGIQRPKVGPLELKCKMGKTPVLDVGTMEKIQSGAIKVCCKFAICLVNLASYFAP